MIGWTRKVAIGVAALALLAAGTLVFALHEARSDPIVRYAAVALPGWPAGARPVTIALASDIHIGNAAMDAKRLARIGDRVSALRPDLIVLAGDFVAGHEPDSAPRIAAGLTAGIRHFRAPMGTLAVLGNHDHWTGAGAVRRALETGGVPVLANESVVRGPLSVVGVDDVFSRHADLRRALGANRRGRLPEIVLTHSPDLASLLPAGRGSLVLAGHTHCGQVVLPWFGAVPAPSLKLRRRLYDPRYRCGAIRTAGRTVIVTSGLGASLPLRIGAAPDIWLVRVGEARRR